MIGAQVGILTFRNALRRQIEHAAVRWALGPRRGPDWRSFDGIVVASATVWSNMSGRPAVLVRTRRKEPTRTVTDSLSGIDFTIEAFDGVRYAVAPSDHLYFDEPPAEPQEIDDATQTSLGPGDAVHVWGTVVSEPAADGERADPRSPPMRLALVGSESAPLVIRLIKPIRAAAGPRLLR